MADKLIYKGGAKVVGQTGNEMQLVLPDRGGSTHRFPRWWNKKGSVAYTECAIFLVTLTTGVKVRLIVPVGGGSQTLEIRHDGNGNFTFPVKGSTERVAVVHQTTNTLYKEYQFSKISGGSVLTRTLQAIPTPVSVTASGSVTGTAAVGETLTVNGATYTGGVGTVSYQLVLQVSADGSTGWSTQTVATAGDTSTTYVVQSGDTGVYYRALTEITDDLGTTQDTSAVFGPIV